MPGRSPAAVPAVRGAFILGWALILSLPILAGPPTTRANDPGAIWTTTSDCQTVDANVQYESKDDVYLNGGPRHGGPGLAANEHYWVRVIAPGGEVLGRSTTANVSTDASGDIVGCLQLWSLVVRPDGTTTGYADTPNPGDEYRVLVSRDEAFAAGTVKADNFKVRRAPEPGATGTLVVTKVVTGFTGPLARNFDVTIDCSGGQTFARSIAYPTPGSVTIAGIALPATCTVAEGSPGVAPTGYRWTGTSVSGTVTLVAGTTVTVTVTNSLAGLTCTELGNCPVPPPTNPPTTPPSVPQASVLAATAVPQASVLAATAEPAFAGEVLGVVGTPPPTDSMPASVGGASGATVGLLMLLLSLMISAAIVTRRARSGSEQG